MFIFSVQEDVNKDVHKDNDNNVDDKAEEPNVNVPKIGSLRKGRVYRGQQGSKNKKAGESSHKAIGKVWNVDEEGEIGDEPKEKRLEKCCLHRLHVEPFKLYAVN